AVEGGDDVLHLVARLRGRRVVRDAADENALRVLDSPRLRELGRQLLRHDAEVAAGDLAARDELLRDVLGQVDRNGEPDPLTRRVDGGVDPDRLAPDVEERTTAVSEVDRCVGLDGVLIRGRSAHDGEIAAAPRADHAHREGAVQLAQRVPDRDRPVADPDLIGVAQRDRGQGAGAVDLDDRDVGARIGADDLRLEFAMVAQRDHDIGRVAHDMVVRKDVPFLIDDEARAAAGDLHLLRRLLLSPRTLRGLREEAAEEVAVRPLELISLAGSRVDPPFALDAHDARKRPVRDLGERAFERGDGLRAVLLRVRLGREVQLAGQDESDDDTDDQEAPGQKQNLGRTYCFLRFHSSLHEIPRRPDVTGPINRLRLASFDPGRGLPPLRLGAVARARLASFRSLPRPRRSGCGVEAPLRRIRSRPPRYFSRASGLARRGWRALG